MIVSPITHAVAVKGCAPLRDIVGESLLVTVAVAEEIPVLSIPCGPRNNPRPRARSPCTKVKSSESKSGGQSRRPASIRYERAAQAQSVPNLVASRVIERTCGSLQIARVDESGIPDDGLPASAEICQRDSQIRRAELPSPFGV